MKWKTLNAWKQWVTVSGTEAQVAERVDVIGLAYKIDPDQRLDEIPGDPVTATIDINFLLNVIEEQEAEIMRLEDEAVAAEVAYNDGFEDGRS